jgi:hypothetical protein
MDEVIGKFDYETITLKKFQYFINYSVDRRFLNDPNIETYFDDFTGNLIVKIRDYIWAEPETKDLEFKYPETIWEYFKEKYAPRWFRNKFPVKYKVYKTDIRMVYPEFKKRVPNERTNLVIGGWYEQ